jgi:hypothetical protein
MNKRLKELAVQAGLEFNDNKVARCDEIDLERFAEIVRQDYLRELKALKPVARVNSEGFIVELGLGLSSGTKLYALDEVKNEP